MRIIMTEKHTVSNNQVLELNLVKNETGNATVGEIYLSTNTNLPYTVQSSVDGTNFSAQSLVNMGTFDIVTSVAAAGNYMITSTGYAKVKITFTGAGDITVKEVF